MNYMGVISEAVKAHMRSAGLSQTALAVELGLTQPTLSNRLNGVTDWNGKDIDALVELGISLPAPRVEVSA